MKYFRSYLILVLAVLIGTVVFLFYLPPQDQIVRDNIEQNNLVRSKSLVGSQHRQPAEHVDSTEEFFSTKTVPTSAQKPIGEKVLKNRIRTVYLNINRLKNSEKVILPLFGDVNLIAVKSKFVELGSNKFTWSGKIENCKSTCEVHFGVSGDALSGTIDMGPHFYEINNAEGNTYIVQEVDRSKFPSTHGDDWPENVKSISSNLKSSANGMALGRVDVSSNNKLIVANQALSASSHRIKFLVLYTELARINAGGDANNSDDTQEMEAQILNQMANTQSVFDNSGLTANIDLVHTAKVPVQTYNEVTDSANSITLSAVQTLNDLRFTGNTLNTFATNLRDRYLADIVILISGNVEHKGGGDSVICGISPLNTALGSSLDLIFASVNAFMVVNNSPKFTCLDNFTLAHEFGHIMGETHDPENSNNNPIDPMGFGYRSCNNTNNSYYGVLAYGCVFKDSTYDATVTDNGYPIPYFSKNATLSDGRALGAIPAAVQSPSSFVTVTGQDAISSMNRNIGKVENFRPALHAPLNLTFTFNKTYSVHYGWLYWNFPIDTSGITGYKIERSVDGGVWQSNYASVNADAHYYSDKNVLDNVKYKYRVYAYNDDPSSLSFGNSYYLESQSNQGIYNDTVAPTVSFAVGQITKVNLGSSVNISVSASDKFFRFKSFILKVGAQTVVSKNGLSDNMISYTWNTTGLTSGIYKIAAVATDEAGNIGSNELNFEVLSKPNSPTSLDYAMNINSHSIDLKWVDNSINETGFTIRKSYKNAIGENITESIAIAANLTTYQDKSITENTVYSYLVYASNSLGNSGNSNQLWLRAYFKQPVIETFMANTCSFITNSQVCRIISGTNVKINVVAKDSTTLANIVVNLNGAKVLKQSTTSPMTFIWQATGASSKQNTFNVSVQNQWKLKSEAIIKFDIISKPTKPSLVGVSAVSKSSVLVVWNAPSFDVTNLYLQRSDGKNWITLPALDIKSTNFTDTGLAQNTVYSYRLYAHNEAGDSEVSTAISVRTKVGSVDFIGENQPLCNLVDLKASLQNNVPEEFYANCSATLKTGDTIFKKIVFRGAGANGQTLDCNGATLKGGLEIRSEKVKIAGKYALDKDGDFIWDRPEQITISNCKVEGVVKIFGYGPFPFDTEFINASRKVYISQSGNLNYYLTKIRKSAPKDITFNNLNLQRVLVNGLIVGIGVSHLSVIGGTISSNGIEIPGNALYVGPESIGNTFKGIKFDVKSRGPQVVIDSSAHNVIVNSSFENINSGGIFLTRNCGIGGAIRITTPSKNAIINNQFKIESSAFSVSNWMQRAVLIGAHEASPQFTSDVSSTGGCRNDDGFTYGSSLSDFEYAIGNGVRSNKVIVRGDVTKVLAAHLFSVSNPVRNSPNSFYNNTVVLESAIDNSNQLPTNANVCLLSKGWGERFMLSGPTQSQVRVSIKGEPSCDGNVYKCNDGILTKESAATDQALDPRCQFEKTAEFNISSNMANNETSFEVKCQNPNKKIVGGYAYCNLNNSDELFANAPPASDLIKVFRASTLVDHGCEVGPHHVDSFSGAKAMNFNAPNLSNAIVVKCKGFAGCRIRGTLYCQ